MNKLKYVLQAIFLIFLIKPELVLSESTTDAGAIKIGVIQSLTGIASQDGKTVVQALQLAAEDINSNGKIKVQLLIEDDGTQSINSVTAFEKLSSQGAKTIIGATWDFTTNALLGLAKRNSTILFNTSTLIESLDMGSAGGYSFINSVTAAEEADAFSKYLDNNKIGSISIVYANNSWGETQLSIYRKISKDHKVEILEELRSSSYDVNEWNIIVAKAKQKKPDLTLLLLNKNDLEMFLRRSSELGFKTKFFASKNLYDALKDQKSNKLFKEVCFTYPYEQLKREELFRAKYKNRFGEDPRIYADNTYDSLFIILKAYEISESEKISLKEAFSKIDYTGVVGRYTYQGASSLTLGKSSLVCVENGELVLN